MPTPQEELDALNAAKKEHSEELERAQAQAVVLNVPAPEDNTKKALTREELDEIKKNLDQMIDGMADNPSLFAQTAKRWGVVPVWQKIILGIFLVVPIFVIGIVFSFHLVIAASIFILIAYVASSIILDNHYSHTNDTTAGLKQGVEGLADALGFVIQSLEALHQELADLVEQLSQENSRLTQNVDNLDGQIGNFTQQNQILGGAASGLAETQLSLSNTAAKLSTNVQEHIALAQRNQQQLSRVQADYEASQLELTSKITDFTREKLSLSLELEKVKGVAAALQVTVSRLTEAVFTDEEDRKSFQKNLQTCLDDEKASFRKIANKFDGTQQKFDELKTQYAQKIAHLQELIVKQEKLVKELEVLIRSKSSSKAHGTENTTPLQACGFYQNRGNEFHPDPSRTELQFPH